MAVNVIILLLSTWLCVNGINKENISRLDKKLIIYNILIAQQAIKPLTHLFDTTG